MAKSVHANCHVVFGNVHSVASTCQAFLLQVVSKYVHLEVNLHAPLSRYIQLEVKLHTLISKHIHLEVTRKESWWGELLIDR